MWARVLPLLSQGDRTGFTPVLGEPGVSFSSPEGSVTSNGNDGVPDSPSDPADREGKDEASFHVRRRWKGGRCQPQGQGPLWPELLFCISQMENGLSAFEEQAEKNLEILCKEKEKLQKKAYELKRRLLLCQKKKELEDFLDVQVRGNHGLQASCPSSVSPLGRVGESLYCECPSSFGFNSVFLCGGLSEDVTVMLEPTCKWACLFNTHGPWEASPAVHWLTLHLQCTGHAFHPWLETKVPHAMGCGRKKKVRHALASPGGPECWWEMQAWC